MPLRIQAVCCFRRFCLHETLTGLQQTSTDRNWHICTSLVWFKCWSAKPHFLWEFWLFLTFVFLKHEPFWQSFVLSCVSTGLSLSCMIGEAQLPPQSIFVSQNIRDAKLNLRVELKRDVLTSVSQSELYSGLQPSTVSLSLDYSSKNTTFIHQSMWLNLKAVNRKCMCLLILDTRCSVVCHHLTSSQSTKEKKKKAKSKNDIYKHTWEYVGGNAFKTPTCITWN